MTIQDLAGIIGAKTLTQKADVNREVTVGYACDLLSRVMARGAAGMAWATVQTHMNVIAVATLMDMACVIVPEGIKVENEVIAKADEEGVAILSSEKTGYELAGEMCAAGIPGR